MALCSSKGYAIGQKFAEWMDARLADMEEEGAELLGHSEDVLSIQGSRMYVFFLDAAPVERLVSQEGSLVTYLEEEEDLQAAGGGKLRKSILLGKGSPPCMAAVRAMAIVCDAVLWPLLRAVKPAADKHVLDVLPKVWPAALAFFHDAAERPRGLVEGDLKIDLGVHAAAAPVAGPSQERRSARAAYDMLRIRAAAKGDVLVERLLAAACRKMVEETENHASEWLPGGKLCSANHTPELYAKYDALVSTSTSVERLHAIGRDVDDRGGMQRSETRGGLVLARANGQAAWLAGKSEAEQAQFLAVCRPEAFRARKETLKAQRIAAGRGKRAERDAKLTSKRAKRAAAAAELVRIKGLQVATRFSELVQRGGFQVSNSDLQDQLKYHKLVLKKTGFTATQANREKYVLQLQALLVELHGAAANDLPAGDSGVEGRGLKKRKASGGGGGKRKKKKNNVTGTEWDEDDEFTVEAIVGTTVSDGVSVHGHRKGTRVYKIIWQGYAAEEATWEPSENIHPEILADYEAGLEAEAQLDAEEAAAMEGDD